MLRGAEVDVRQVESAASEANKGRQAQRIGDGVQAVPNAIVANLQRRTTATIEKTDQLQGLLPQKEGEPDRYRHRAEEAERELQLANDSKAQMRLKIVALTEEVKNKTDALKVSQALCKALKRRIDGAKGRTDFSAWAEEPTRGMEALARLRPGGVAAGPPRFVDIVARRTAGDLRDVHMHAKSDACACKRELAVNGLAAEVNERFNDAKVLGQGGFGIVYSGKCKKTNAVYAIKKVLPGKDATTMIRELAAYAILKPHKNIISVKALSDVAGSEGLIMEVAVCDLYQAAIKTSVLEFNVIQVLKFAADASEGLSYMHSVGMVHCDHKLVNTLVCRSDGPAGFIGKVTDPGVWCGVGEMRGMKNGTLARVPLENVLGDVLAAPNQDTFALGVDACFILASPAIRTRNDDMWTHWNLLTKEEAERTYTLQVAGADMTQHWADISLRTKTDGSLARVLLQPDHLSPIVPPSERSRTCEVLRNMVSPHPADRGEMSDSTRFLRDLAVKMTTYVDAIVANTLAAGTALPSLVGHPPVVGAPAIAPALEVPAAGLVRVGGDRSGGAPAGAPSVERVYLGPPPVAAPYAEGEGENDPGPPAADPPVLVEAVPAAHVAMPSLEENVAGAPSVERVYLAPPPVAAPHAEGEGENDPGPPAADPPVLVEAVPAANVAMPSLEENVAGASSVERVYLAPPPVAAPYAEGEGVNDSRPPAANPPVLVGAVEPANVATPPPEENEAGGASVERMHLPPPPPVAVPHVEGGRDDAGAEIPLAEAALALSGSEPLAAAPLAEEEAADADMAYLEEINGRLDLLLRPLPRTPAEVLANNMANILRTLHVPHPAL